MHLYRALLFRRDYFARPDASHHWKAIAKNISARPFRQIHIFLHRIKEKIFSLLTFLPSFAFILPYSKAVIDMFKGFQICPGLVYYIPLNIIRCQQLVDQNPMLLQQLFKLRIGNADCIGSPPAFAIIMVFCTRLSGASKKFSSG